MLIKAGVDISRLKREIRRSLHKVEAIYNKYNEELIITSTYEGNHGAGSLHYANDAYDARKANLNRPLITNEIKKELGKHFDIVIECDHLHIEYDPK